ncbi:glycoside hydrolase family 32 protein [Pseudobacillus wudalianchiensis]|uniref:Sucrose-6-phosphate hydrolase n=1 Tax=Pseudobacillus wudalianchiensis TaxID=1743143 RepID=A0A1B9AGC1_9BACI|nr:sucrose-6-phosphate hydrolase [Bacillus wudalianchiensis]OCA82878.1 sucrose-6-phosphate hydrolase [Bacillus wudalianchiensis]
MNQQEWLQQVAAKVKENEENRKKDPYRLLFHLMPPVGLLNDPNGLIQYRGRYHVFYQWNPFATSHGPKFWGHYISDDLVHWEEKPPALTPTEWYDKHGCYSGSAIEEAGKLLLFYTGNVKKGEQRETYQCAAVSDNGVQFEKEGPVILLPAGFTAHFRDPKVWKRNDRWYMVVGAQTIKEEGVVVLFSSSDLRNWHYKGPIAGSCMNGLGHFGYMWECPDFFQMDDKDILLVSPQGLKPDGYRYENLFQSGYFIGEWKEGTTEFAHGEFSELDRGFDFYAAQTFKDEQGRRIMIGWMGITDEQELFQPTIKKGWVHALTLPRELVLEGTKLLQKPVVELMKLRRKETFHGHVSLGMNGKTWGGICEEASEIKVQFDELGEEKIEIEIRGNVTLLFCPIKKLFTLRRKSYKDGAVESRTCELLRLEDVHIFLDTSSLEVFINGGQEVFTARFFADPEERSIVFKTNGRANLFIQKWKLGN